MEIRNLFSKTENIKQYKNFVEEKTFPSLTQFREQLKDNFKMEEIKWDFFHPFYTIMMKKYQLFQMKEIYFDKANRCLLSLFNINNKDMSKADLIITLYNFLDEICGLFVYKFDENVYFTTQIALENITALDLHPNEEIDKLNKQNYVKFLCLLSLTEMSKDRRKIVIKFNLYKIDENEERIKFNLILAGMSKFQRPRINLQMAKF